MAARGGSLSIGSEPVYDFYCTPCSKEDKHDEATKFCVECGENFCVTCLRYHNKFKAMRNHKLLDENGLKGQGPHSRVHLPTENCPLHFGKLVDMFCPVDDAVCCAACIAEAHRLCKGVVYIPNILSNFQSSTELVQLTIDKMKADIEALKTNRKYYVKKLEDESKEIRDELKSNRKRIDKHLDDLDQQVIDDLDSKLSKLRIQANQEIAKLEERMTVFESHEKDMQVFHGHNDANFFVSVKQAKAAQKENESLIIEIDSRQKRSLNFIINSNVSDMVCKVDSMGRFQENIEIKSASLLGKFNVKTGTDILKCSKLGSCFVADGSIVITDWNNKKLKLLDEAYNVLSECVLPASPEDISRTGPREVAVMLQTNKSIQFATVTDKIRLTRSFVVDLRCNSIAYYKGELFVSGTTAYNKEEIHVYTITGTHLRTIAHDEKCDRMSCHTQAIAVKRDQIYFSDYRIGVITTDLNGRYKQSRCTGKIISGPFGLFVTDDGYMFVCEYSSHNVLLVSPYRRENCVLLSEKDGIKNPLSVLCDGTRLIVTMNEDYCIYVYNLHHV